MRFLLRLLGLSSLSLMVVLLLSSDVRNIVILRVNLIKVTSSSYRHQLSPSSRHNRGGANISSTSKDLLNWSSSSTLLLTTNPRPSCVYDASTSIQHVLDALFLLPRRTQDSQDTPHVVACPVVALLRYGGVTLADLCLPCDADIVRRGKVSERKTWGVRSRGNRNATSLILTRNYSYSQDTF